MKINFPGFFLGFFLIFIFPWLISCSGSNGRVNSKMGARVPVEQSTAAKPGIRMISPEENGEYKLKSEIRVQIAPDGNSQGFDSVKFYYDGQLAAVTRSQPWECSIGTDLTSLTGRKSVKAVGYTSNRTEAVTRFVIVYSDTKPAMESFAVVKAYPHDNTAFTQGLFYDRGILFEGTGQESGSSLREVELETGKILRQHNLDPSLFGEGITLYNNMIYQVTWRNKVGFIYNKSDFTVLNRLNYTTEGWGLTTMDEKIVMSDGTNVLYFRDPGMFSVVSRIEVYDNEKKVDQLNELEYINGEIWANIWTTDLIARIDPSSGKVNSYIDFSGLFPEAKRREVDADVLNGIAWDPEGKRIFITGKRWPKLYEIRITK